jgi:hypothetical protein
MKEIHILTGAALACAALVHPAYSAQLITSDGAWTTTAVNATSNGGLQDNSNTGGSFGLWAGPSFLSNGSNQYLDMQASATSVQQTYTAGYTYSYQSTARAPNVAYDDIQVVSLTSNAAVVAGTPVAGSNNTGTFGTGDPNTVNGSYVVSTGNAVIGQTVGVRISGEGVQSRFWAEAVTATAGSGVSALLTEHANFNGDGNIYSTSFNAGGAGDIDHVLDMTLSGVGEGNGDIFLNNTTTIQNIMLIGSADDTFRAGTIYRITFDAKKQIEQDSAQNDLTISLGTYTTDITIGNIVGSYTFDVDADAAGIVGQLLGVGIKASALTTTGLNQYKIYDLDLVAIPEPGSYALAAGLLGLGSVMVRRRQR